jgi:HtrA serine peptidase 4
MFANLQTVPSLLQEMKRQDPEFPDVSSGVFVYEVIQGSAAAR